MKRLTIVAIAALLSASALPGAAQGANAPGAFSMGCIGGALAGGLLGNQVGQGDGKTVATAIGSVLGCNAGQNFQGSPAQTQAARAPHSAYPQPSYGYGPRHGYPAPVAPSQSAPPFAPHCFAQWRGDATPQRPISPQGGLAMAKARDILAHSSERVAVAEIRYAQAHAEMVQARGDLANPQTRLLMGNGMDGRAQRTEQLARQASNDRTEAERHYFADIARALDACEYSAARGEDVTAFSSMEALMRQPMAEQWSYTSRTDGRRIVIAPAPTAYPQARGLPAPAVPAPFLP
jgi:hypothetical protein